MNRDQLPVRLAARPFDDRRGLPIPYVSEHDGHVDFAVVNGARLLDCVRRGLCSACGQPYEQVLAFIGGPGGFAMRRYTDPLPGLVFIPQPWITATRFEYRDGALTEVGPEPIAVPEAKP